MLKVSTLHKGLSDMDRIERIKIGLAEIRQTQEEAADAIERSHISVRMALSGGGGRDRILELLESHIEKILESRGA